jgi:REP element-mobilizing transposase RayT
LDGCPTLGFQRVVALDLLRMPLGLKRHYGSHHLHFITCSCNQRLPLLGTPRARNIFVKTLGELRRSHGFALIGYVVMPEHVHLLIGARHALDGSAALEAARLTNAASRRRGPRGFAILDAAILRLQRLEHEEEKREAWIHACEPSQTRACDSCERLGVEQLFVLRA